MKIIRKKSKMIQVTLNSVEDKQQEQRMGIKFDGLLKEPFFAKRK